MPGAGGVGTSVCAKCYGERDKFGVSAFVRVWPGDEFLGGQIGFALFLHFIGKL